MVVKVLLFGLLKKVFNIFNDLFIGLWFLLKFCCVKVKILIENIIDLVNIVFIKVVINVGCF